jgi:hypothetical protein
MSRDKFGAEFGITARYVEAIEYGDRRLTGILKAEIALRYGLVPESLEGKRFPRSMLDTKNLTVSEFSDDDGTLVKSVEISLDEFCNNVGADTKEARLQVLMHLWQKSVISLNPDRIDNALRRKLDLLFVAAMSLNRYYSVANQLSMWIDSIADAFELKQLITQIRGCLTGEDAEWPTFFETLMKTLKERNRKPESVR